MPRRDRCPAHVGDKRHAATSTCARRYAGDFSEHVVDRYCVAGTPEECAARVREYVDAGARHVVFNVGEPEDVGAAGGGGACCRSLTSASSRSSSSAPGPWGTLQLADLGAEVIKIEDPAVRRRRRPLRAAVPGGRGLALLRDVQPQQEERLARPAPRRRRASVLRGPRPRVRRRLLEPARRPAARSSRLTYDDLKDVNPRIVCCSLSGFGMTGPARRRGRLRLHDARARRVDEPDRRPGRARRRRAASRSSTSPAATCRRSPCSPGSGARAATASAATATSRCSRPRCTS